MKVFFTTQAESLSPSVSPQSSQSLVLCESWLQREVGDVDRHTYLCELDKGSCYCCYYWRARGGIDTPKKLLTHFFPLGPIFVKELTRGAFLSGWCRNIDRDTLILLVQAHASRGVYNPGSFLTHDKQTHPRVGKKQKKSALFLRLGCV